MTNNFITNSKGATLKKRLETLISASQELKFLVGFFYFSGWQELYKTLEKNNDVQLKILVGLEVDRHLGKLVEMDLHNGNSFEEQTEYFMQSLTKAVSHKDMDHKDFYEQVEFFIGLLETNRLCIRKTFESNHAKLYLFQLNEPTKELFGSKGSFITGSSNFTKAGLHNQHEFNVEIKDYGFTNAEAYFDKLWQTAVPITENEIGKRRIINILRNKSLATNITKPFEAYVFILKTYLDLQKAKDISDATVCLLKENGFEKYSYQLDAVGQALSIIDEYNGVIIADVVGLGKSVIASLIASQLDTRGLVLCPPGLVGDRHKATGWHEYKEKFKLHSWDIESVGMVETLAENQQNKDYDVVIVDEAHRFRNEDTTSYEALLDICRGKKVILLTATPFNNSPTDVFSLLKLFIIPGASSISLGGDLYGKFRAYDYRFKGLTDIVKNYNSEEKEKKEKAETIYLRMFEDSRLPIDIQRVKENIKAMAEDIKNTISPVVIRRNRIDLLKDSAYSKEIGKLSKINDPKEQFFSLSEKQSDFYDEIISDYFAKEKGRFKGAIYQPFTYVKKKKGKLKMEENRAFIQQSNLFDFMRRLLVKRFESSFGAFEKSIERFLRVHKIVLSFIETSGKYVLDRKRIEDIYTDDESDDDFIEEDIIKMLKEFEENAKNKTSPKHTTIYDINKFNRKDEFLQDIKNDLAMFEEIKEKMANLNLVENDPKRASIVEKIKEVLEAENNPKRKVILFTEYTDTVRHLKDFFEKELNRKVAFCSGGISKGFADELKENFDVKSEKQKDDYDVLVTSDKLSEGFNFNRAGLIINYDIPWNPTRVIQRVGRINRMSAKVFDELWIYNFFPTERGADLVKSRKIAEQKMFLIHNALGEDAKIFDADETPIASGLYKKVSSNPDDNEEISESTFIRNEYKKISEQYPQVIERISEFPNRVKTAKLFDEENVVVLRKKGLALFAVTHNYKEEKAKLEEQNLSGLLRLTRCEFDTLKQEISEEFWTSYKMIESYKPQFQSGNSGQSLQNEALNSLKSLQKNKEIELSEEIHQFIVTLVNDIKNYKTLSDQTLRRLKLQDGKKQYEKLVENIKQLQRRLGSDYLDIMLQRNANLEDDIIIAINNLKG